ncbi:alpha/beta fold hydrolase [Chloroflexota bacterium]
MTDVSREKITVQGLPTAYAVQGAGPAAVLALHGWGGNIESFWPVAQQLAPLGSYTIYVLDLPGFGETAPPPEPWGVPEYADFVLAFLDALGLDRMHLLGHSFGGRISLILGADHADRVDKMVLANSAGVPNPPNPLRDSAVKAAKSVLGLPGLKRLYEPTRRKAYEQLGATDYLDAGALQETFVKVVAQDLLPYAARISRPTLLVWGDQDQDTPLWQGKKLAQTIPGAGLVEYAGAGHFSYLDRLPDYVRVVNFFLTDDSEGTA